MRRSAKRPQTAALKAAGAGRPAYLPNPSHTRKKALSKRKKRSQKPSRGSNPLFKILGIRRNP